MAQTYNTQLPNVTLQFLKKLKVPVTQTYLEESIQSHPYYPSLYSISDVLSKLNIDNIATEIQPEQFDELEPPFITYLSHLAAGKDFVLVTKISPTEVEYLYEGTNSIKERKEIFIKKWLKIVLLAEAGVASGQYNYAVSLNAEKKKIAGKQLLTATAITVFILAVGLFLAQVGFLSIIPACLILFSKILGVAITVLLLWYETDKTNPFIKNICTSGTKTNCDAVLSSTASKILGVSWAEAGFFYFAGSILFLLFPGLLFKTKLHWLAISASIVAPYIIFSIWYQYKIIKQWCPLCLATQAVIAAELIVSIIFFWQAPAIPLFNGTILIIFLIVIVIPLTVWYFLKPILLQSKNSNIYHYAYQRILFNPDYFQLLLQKQPNAPNGWQQLGIDFGNSGAANTIIKICNPYCGPCAKAHSVLEELINKNENLNVKIIFSFTNETLVKTTLPAKHLLAIAALNDEEKTKNALDDWYLTEQKDYELFKKKYPMNGEVMMQDTKIDEMKKWCNEAGITHTPTYFLNGKLLPVDYTLKDIEKLL